MEITANALGRILACLQIRRTLSNTPGTTAGKIQLSGAEQKLLEFADHRLEEIAAAPGFLARLEQLTKYRCQTGKSCLKDNLDFFLALLFLKTDGDSNVCECLFTHLNACYHCFEEFSEVMRYYFNTLESLEK
ncbi:MAG: hypothetical protein HUU32_16090 [Calditrichaceae bacterium]|nr:hypothetical protein [Calditrichia bacterium]NUQ42909.1 hypothetical protein [Calditrichaceae bacterium]